MIARIDSTTRVPQQVECTSRSPLASASSTIRQYFRESSFAVTPEPSLPNAFEIAILAALSREHPSLIVDVNGIRVRSRSYTGVGSYTDFLCEASGEQETVGLTARIAVPGIRNGMGAALICRGRRPECLETFTLGDEFWSGSFEGFSVG